MHTFGPSQRVVYDGVTLRLLMPPHEEITLCYCPSTGYFLPCLPTGSDIMRLEKALGHPVAGSWVG